MELERMMVVKVLRDSPQLFCLDRRHKMQGMRRRVLTGNKKGIIRGIRILPHKLSRC